MINPTNLKTKQNFVFNRFKLFASIIFEKSPDDFYLIRDTSDCQKKPAEYCENQCNIDTGRILEKIFQELKVIGDARLNTAFINHPLVEDRSRFIVRGDCKVLFA